MNSLTTGMSFFFASLLSMRIDRRSFSEEAAQPTQEAFSANVVEVVGFNNYGAGSPMRFHYAKGMTFGEEILNGSSELLIPS